MLFCADQVQALPVATGVPLALERAPLVEQPSDPDDDDDGDEDDDDLSDDDGNSRLLQGALLGLQELEPGAEPRQRIGTSKCGISKKSWTKAEDAILAEIVEKNGAARWSNVASHLPGRAGKQCRERWFNHLCPEVKKGSWTAEEDRVIMESVARYGTRWSKIVKLMPGRTDNAIKNRYNSAMRRKKRLERLQNGGESPTGPPPPAARTISVAAQPAKRKRDEATVTALPTGGLPTAHAEVWVEATPAGSGNGGATHSVVAVATISAPVIGPSNAPPAGRAPASSPDAVKPTSALVKPTGAAVGRGGGSVPGMVGLMAPPKHAPKKARGSKKSAVATATSAKADVGLDMHVVDENLRVPGLSPPSASGLSPGQLAQLLATQEGVAGVDFSTMHELLLAHTSPPLSQISSGFTRAMGDEALTCDEPMSDEHISPSQQISLLLEQEGIKALPESSPFDFAGSAMASSMPPPPPRSAADGKKAPPRRAIPAKPSSCASLKVKGTERQARGENMPPEQPREGNEAVEEKRLSEGTILELFEHLDGQRQAGEAGALAAVGGAAAGKRGASAATPAPPILPVDVSLAEQSGASKQSAEGTSPFNQLSPIQLNDLLKAF